MTDGDAANPWLGIPAADYEGHMGDPRVAQLRLLGDVFEESLREFRPAAVVVPGCATGNGFERIDPAATRRIVGIDINPEFLALARNLVDPARHDEAAAAAGFAPPRRRVAQLPNGKRFALGVHVRA